MNAGKAIKTLLFACVLASCPLAGPVAYAQSPTADGVDLKEAQQVTLLSFDNAHPGVAISPDGRHLFVVWDGVVDGNRRIFLREQIAGEWLPPVIVDSIPAGDNAMPSIAIDSAGIPHIAWISHVGSKRQPFYARRISRFPNVWHQQAVPFPADSTVDGNCDYVSLRLDANDHPWITWQFGFGNVYSVACTRSGSEGRLYSEELTPGANSHNLYPEIFFLPQPTVYWYLAQADQFYLIGSQYNAETHAWSVSLPDNFENVPAQSFPDLFLTASGPLGAIWYDRLSNQTESNDQVFMGVQNPESHGRGEVVDQNGSANNHSVSAAILDDRIVAAWVSENYKDGTLLYMGLGDSPATLHSGPVAGSVDGIISNPRVTATDNKAAVAWEETSGPGLISTEIMVRVAEIK